MPTFETYFYYCLQLLKALVPILTLLAFILSFVLLIALAIAFIVNLVSKIACLFKKEK